MSFSSQVKEELLQVEMEEDCCLQAMAYGMLLFSRSFTTQSIYLKTENYGVAKKYQELIGSVSDVKVKFERSKSGFNKVSVPLRNDRIKLLERFGHTGKEIALRINRANISEDCCMGAFLRGIFLVCGIMTLPQREYHLEYSVPFRKLSIDLLSLLGELELNPKVTTRNGYNIIYFKESEAIEDLLTTMGAVKSSLEIMNVKIYKDFRNKVNRVINCETANIAKTVNAAAVQLEAIQKIIAHGKLDSFSEDVRELALLRLDNPELSLRELGEQLSPPMTRSGVNHRMKKLLDMANELE